MESTKSTIAAKLLQISGDIGYLQKDKRNAQQSYNYLSEQAIKEAVQPLLVKHGVLFSLSLVSQETAEAGTTKSGSVQFRTAATFRYRFTDVENGQYVEGDMPGAGMDTQDKGIYKAITGALKYALTTTLLIATGDDAEDDTKDAGPVVVAAQPRTAAKPAAAVRALAPTPVRKDEIRAEDVPF